MNYSSRFYLVAINWLLFVSIAIADTTSNRSYPPLPTNLESVELNRIANAIELSARVTGTTSRVPTRDVVWVKVFVDNKGKPTSLKSVHWTVKDLWVEDVAELVSVLTFENAREQIESSIDSWYYQPVVFSLFSENPITVEMEDDSVNLKTVSRSSPHIIVEPIPIHFENTEPSKKIKRNDIGKATYILAQIGTDGKVMDAELTRSTGSSNLDKAAFANALKSRFTPLFINGQREVGWVLFETSFHNRDAPKRSTSTFKSSIIHSAPTGEFVPVEIMPKMIAEIPPEYPRWTKRAGLSSTVWIKVLVGIDGRVVEATVAKSSDYPALDDAALKVANQNLFKPAIGGGILVPIWITYKVEFY